MKNTFNQHYQMISMEGKRKTKRTAIAQGSIIVGKKAFELIRENKLPKGNALEIAEIAGILGAKKTSDLIPLCHPLELDHAAIYTELNEENFSITVYCRVSITAKTGVEMEALMGVNAALLTIYDLTKMVEPALTICDVRLLVKEGGKKGLWIHPDGVPKKILESFYTQKTTWNDIKVAVITSSDRASHNEYDDKSGKILCEAIKNLHADVCDYTIVPDNTQSITQKIKIVESEHAPQLILLTGGTGLSPRDVTPDAVKQLSDRLIPGFGELLRHHGGNFYNQFAWLSRSVAGVMNNTLIITLPGNPKAINECVSIIQDLIPHALHMISGGHHD